MEAEKTTQSFAGEKEGSPGFGARRIPAWMGVSFIVVFLCTQFYVTSYSGSFRSDVYDARLQGPPAIPIPPGGPDGPDSRGKIIYKTTCVYCHQPDGRGVAGVFPPLAGSEWVNASNPARVIRIALDGASGPITVSSLSYNNTMVSWRDNLKSDEDLAAVLTYVRSAWGNHAPTVSAEVVRTIRAGTEVRSKDGPYSETELKSIPIE